MRDPVAEYEAARSGAALFDLTGRTQLDVRGGDRLRFLHNFCTNEIQKRQPGEGCEAFLTNVKGRVLGHVYAWIGEESIVLDTAAGQDEPLTNHLDRYILADDVELTSRTEDVGILYVCGPEAAGVLAKAGVAVEGLEAMRHRRFDLEGTPADVRHVDLLGQPGYELVCGRDALSDLRERVVGAGAVAAERDVFEALRIEALTPLFGADISDEILAPEVGRDDVAISYTKGCYLGQEPIARIDALGHVNKILRGLRLEAGTAPPPGAAVRYDDKDVGRVASSVSLPDGSGSVALAYLKTVANQPGTKVDVAGEGEDDRLAAEVFGPRSTP